jgi:hypothetical protein
LTHARIKVAEIWLLVSTCFLGMMSGSTNQVGPSHLAGGIRKGPKTLAVSKTKTDLLLKMGISPQICNIYIYEVDR